MGAQHQAPTTQRAAARPHARTPFSSVGIVVILKKYQLTHTEWVKFFNMQWKYFIIDKMMRLNLHLHDNLDNWLWQVGFRVIDWLWLHILKPPCLPNLSPCWVHWRDPELLGQLLKPNCWIHLILVGCCHTEVEAHWIHLVLAGDY